MTPTFLSLTPQTLDTALELMARFYAGEALDFQPHRARRALEHLLANHDLGVFSFIQLDGRIAGYFVLTLGFSLEFGGRFALLDEFYVEPAHRGHGMGATALDYIERIARSYGVAALRLEVDRANPRVRAFYQRAGFQPHDRDLMTKWLV